MSPDFSLCTFIQRMVILLLFSSAAVAQSYPIKPVRLIVPFSAGGPTDFVARIIANRLTATLGQSFLVDNRAGGGGNIATEAVAKAAPDGYTLLVANLGPIAINPSLYRNMTVDPSKDLEPVILTNASPLAFVTPSASAYKSIADVLKAARAKPGSLDYATAGVGTPAHIAAELFKTTAGVSITHIPYRGDGQAIQDIISNRVPLAVLGIATAIGQAKNETVRVLAVTSASRSSALPEIPTLQESGLSGFEAATWHGIMGPAGTPSEVVAKLNTEIKRILSEAEVRRTFQAQGLEVVGNTPEQFRDFIRAEVRKWAKVVKDSGAHAE